MKYHVFITKKEILTGLLFIVGLFLFFHGIHSAYQCNHALDLNTLEERELREGVCVSGNIDTYIVKHFPENNKFHGVGQSYLTLSGQSYDFYTIPVGKKSYICILANSKSLKEQLEAFEGGHGENVYFEGEVIKPFTELNWRWYNSIEGFRTEDLIGSFVIKETHFKRNKDIIYIGVLLLALAVLRFRSAGGMKNFVMEETEDEKPVYNNYAKIYSSDYELQAEQMQLRTLERRMHSVKRNAILCVPLLLAGFYILYRVSLLFGILFIIIAIKGIWKGFTNSTNTVAKALVRKCNLKSLSVEIEEHERNMEKLAETENRRERT